MTVQVPASMLDFDVATQAELNAVQTALGDRIGVLEQPGRVVQAVSTATGAVASGTTLVPRDDTIPQITEGDQYMLANITPRFASSTLRIDVVFNGASSVASWLQAALFRDAAANALGTVQFFVGSANEGGQLVLTVFTPAASVAATTFRVRAGLNVAGTLTFNGTAGARLYGGVCASSITVTEIAA